MKYYLGIDAGATKTAGLLADSQGKPLASCLEVGIAMQGQATQAQGQALLRIRDQLLSKAGLRASHLAGLGLGISGAGDFKNDQRLQQPALAGLFSMDSRKLVLANDGIAALWAASNAQACVILQYGTGYVGAWRSAPGKEELFDTMDMSGLFDLRQEAFKTAARMLMGLKAPSALLEDLLKFWNVHSEEELKEGWFRGGISGAKANTPPIIFKAWLAGEAAAKDLVESAARDYSLAAAAMVRNTRAAAPVVCFGGGVLSRAPEAFHSLLSKQLRELCPQALPSQPRLPAQAGACLMAAASQGEDTAMLFKKLEGQRSNL